jgi:hypothetical protein
VNSVAIDEMTTIEPGRFDGSGYLLIDGYLSEGECARLLAAISAFRERVSLPLIDRPHGKRPLRYFVIDGRQIAAALPGVSDVFRRTGRLVKRIAGDDMEPLEDARVACNVNITPPGGAYRWHYDRNSVTALLYLNAVEGGETECYPNYRIDAKRGAALRISDRLLRMTLARWLSRKRLIVEPRPGRLLVMRGDRCLHSVRPLGPGPDRVNLVMSFDRPGRTFATDASLNDYLYSTAGIGGDPNYPANRS